MKLQNNKFLLSLLISLGFFCAMASTVMASAPQVIIKVQDEHGVPMPGVMVKWVDKNQDYIYQPTATSSYHAEDEFHNNLDINPGEALFRSWDIRPDQGGFPESNTLVGPQIDHDFDSSTPTVPQWFVNRELEGWDGRFGCGQNPHTFSAIAPPNMGLNCTTTEGVLKNQELVNRYTITCQRTAPQCPGNIRQVACDEKNQTVTVTWDAPPGGADGYRFYLDADPFTDKGQIGENDFLNQDFSNNLSRTVPIKYDLDYILHLKSTRTVNGQELQSDPSCLAKIRCESKCVPGSPGCKQTPCPGGNCTPQPPKATLSSCPIETAPYYEYSISDINTFGLPFIEAKLMITFGLNAQTQQILNFLTNSSNSSTADFSLWNEKHRQKQTGDYFGFYIQRFTSLPSSNTLSYRIGPNTRIGQKTMAELQQFLIQHGMSTRYPIKANMTTGNSLAGTFFNSHIPAPERIDLSNDFNKLCLPPEPLACPTIAITKPVANEVVTPVNNKVTVTWSATDAAPGTEYEVIVYDKKAYASPELAYQAYLVGVSVPIAMPTNLIVYTTTNTAQVVNFNDIDGLNPYNWNFAIRSAAKTCVQWTSPNPPPLPPGFPVSGKIYEYNPSCQPLQEIPIGGTIAVTPGVNPTIPVTGGAYSSSLPQSDLPYTLQLTLNDPAYTCANLCGQGPSCVRDNINQTNNTANFFVSQQTVFENSWWQVFGGHVFSENTMNSELPITDSNQSWRLIGRLISSIAETAGIPLTNNATFGNNAPDNSNVAGWLSDRDPQLQASSANIHLNIQPNYSYYRDKFDTLNVQLPDEIKNVTDLQGQNTNGVTVYYKEGDLKFDPATPWIVDGNQNVVVLVNGNITFSAENLSSENALALTRPGSTVTFIAAKDIIVAGNVGNADLSATPNLSGIFIGKRILVQGGEDKRFVGEGSFIGWSGVLLQRQYSDKELNKTNSTETFIYRPDLTINFPEVLRDTNVTWKEVN